MKHCQLDPTGDMFYDLPVTEGKQEVVGRSHLNQPAISWMNSSSSSWHDSVLVWTEGETREMGGEQGVQVELEREQNQIYQNVWICDG